LDRLLALLPLAACGGGMALCMWLMNRGHRQSAPDAQQASQTAAAPAADAATRREVIELREEVDRLRAELQQRSPQPRA
jgi:hypothetical protein